MTAKWLRVLIYFGASWFPISLNKNLKVWLQVQLTSLLSCNHCLWRKQKQKQKEPQKHMKRRMDRVFCHLAHQIMKYCFSIPSTQAILLTFSGKFLCSLLSLNCSHKPNGKRCIFLYLANEFTIHWNSSFGRFLNILEKFISKFSKAAVFIETYLRNFQ